jgi:hypothetical protein
MREDLFMVLDVLLQISNQPVLAVDVTGEFSPVNVRGWFRRFLHYFQHSDKDNSQNFDDCNQINQTTNLALLQYLTQKVASE